MFGKSNIHIKPGLGRVFCCFDMLKSKPLPGKAGFTIS